MNRQNYLLLLLALAIGTTIEILAANGHFFGLTFVQSMNVSGAVFLVALAWVFLIQRP